MVLIVMKGCAIVYEPGLDLHLFHFTPYCYNAGHDDVIANERMSIPISKRKNNLLSIAMYNRQVLENTILISQCAPTDLDVKFTVASDIFRVVDYTLIFYAALCVFATKHHS